MCRSDLSVFEFGYHNHLFPAFRQRTNPSPSLKSCGWSSDNTPVPNLRTHLRNPQSLDTCALVPHYWLCASNAYLGTVPREAHLGSQVIFISLLYK
jgi:hypothetical protein